ncbi:hypothetical protein EVAR_75503_1 [Eumeta japonica]|uniref:Uncharacterized protein n=1 Tax=Eumeta variegata TaxID=151549 RepID=A0A4C1TN82_EUMVA|nr:hypothetical protein EVAR_75503_1 [Eumeta japonica]
MPVSYDAKNISRGIARGVKSADAKMHLASSRETAHVLIDIQGIQLQSAVRSFCVYSDLIRRERCLRLRDAIAGHRDCDGVSPYAGRLSCHSRPGPSCACGHVDYVLRLNTAACCRYRALLNVPARERSIGLRAL